MDDQKGVVTAVSSTSGDVSDDKELMELTRQHEETTGKSVETVVADSKYGTVRNFIDCQERQIETHMADLQKKQAGTGRRKGIFGESKFVYDAASDTYRCPAGQTLRPRRYHAHRQSRDYLADRGVCSNCPLQAQCTRGKTGRSVKRHDKQELLNKARGQSDSRRGRRDRRRRQHLIEGSFGDGANNHHLKRSRWRGLWRQRIQDYVIAAIQNIRLMVKHAAGPLSSAGAAAGGRMIGPRTLLSGRPSPVWRPLTRLWGRLAQLGRPLA